uniref:Uncharacterized protein n=1 Tax=Romanomermis culicivorax TaxID=13658 RepID=A0A915JJL8_ROMCU
METNKNLPSNYKIYNIFYQYNKTSSNFIVFAKEGLDFEDGSFYTICSSPIANKECSKSIIIKSNHALSVADNVILPEVYRIYFIALEENARSSNIKESVKLNISNNKWQTMDFDTSLSKWGLLTDNLEDPFYLLSEFINEIVNEIDSIPGVKFPGAENKLAWKMAQVEISWLKTATKTISKVGKTLLPMVAVALDAPLLYSSVRDIINGDANARTIFNTATATVGISMTLLTTDVATKAMLTIFPNILGPISWTILAVGAATYFTNRIWDVNEEMDKLQKLVKFDAVEYTFEFFRRLFFMGGSSYATVVEHEKKVNNIRLEYGIKLLEKNKNIQNFVSTASCYDADNAVYTICKSVFIDLMNQSTSISVDKTDPDIPNNQTEHYEHLCHMAKSFKHQQAGKVLNMLTSFFKYLFASKSTQSKPNLSFKCIEAFGIRRKQTTPNIMSSAHQISFYLLIGSCYVYGLNDTYNIFSLSNGQHCTLHGGGRGNRFQFVTIFQNCTIDGYGRTGNSIDFSQLDVKQNFNIVAEGENIIKLIDSDESIVLGKVRMKNVDTVIFGRTNNSDFLEADCFLDTVKIYCDETPTDVQHELYIPYKKHCNYSMKVIVSGKALISNEATFGQFVYTSHKVKGNISLNLKGSEHASHVYVASFADINSIGDFIFEQNSSSIIVKIVYNEFEIYITMTEPKTLQITFTENIKFHYDNGLHHLVIFHPETKGQLWTRYRLALELFSRRHIPVRAYSERDQEKFSFYDGKILIDDIEMNYSMPPNDEFWAQEPQFQCKEGYNVFVFHPFCYPSQRPKVEGVSQELLTCFSSAVIDIDQEFDFLILDMTTLTFYMDKKDKFYDIYIQSEVSGDTMILKFIGNRLNNNTYYYAWNIGSITLKNILRNGQYKKLKIMAKSDFVLTPNDHGEIEATPLPKAVCPFSRLVVLEHHVIEEGQTFLFNDRIPTAFDVIRIQSSLVITNLAHKITESLIRLDPSITLSTIILKNFFDNVKMETLKLKFGTEDYSIDLTQWESLPILSHDEWREKLKVMNDYLNEEAFLMHYDIRFRTDMEYLNLAT